jgi:parallel beta-helix repeat protein
MNPIEWLLRFSEERNKENREMEKRRTVVGFVAIAVLLLANGFILTPNVAVAQATEWTGLGAPYSVAIGDYDNDGSNDIAFTEIVGSERLSVYKSDGVTLIKQWTGLGGLRGVAIGDYNNDGSNDIAFAQTPSLGGGTVEVYENDGVTLITQWTGLSSPLQISIGDYDNDGLNDLAFTESVSDKVTVYRSDGITIIKQWTGLVGHPFGVAIGDYDNDGLNDLAFTEATGNVTVCRSDGVTIIKQWTGLSHPAEVDIGDYDNDGLNDLAFSEYDADTVTVYKSDGVTIIEQLTGLSGPYGIAIGDYNNDGSNDLAICEYDANRVIVHYGARAEHELITSVAASPSITLGGSSLLNATVTNRGSNNETNVEFLLLINGTAVNSTTIPLLKVDSSYTLSYSWTPAAEGTYNITSYARPVFGETRVKNNQQSKFTTVWAETSTVTIYIKADGSIDPVTAPVSIFDNVIYTLTNNIVGDFPEESSAIVVERDNIMIDGAFHTLRGNGSGTGIALFDKSARASSNVSIMNMQITAFMAAIMGGHSNIRIQGNNITANRWGILLEGAEDSNIYKNNIRDNSEGITLVEADGISVFENNIENNTRGVTVARIGGNLFYCNNFINNTDQVYIIGSPHCVNSWDKDVPSGGNYWSDYNGVDSNGDGLGDTPYIIDADNQDRYPLINRWTPTVEPSPEVHVGVKAGDWIKIDYTISGAPAGTPLPQWLKVEFLSVEGTSATVRVTMHMSDGSEQDATVPVDVVAGGQALGLSGFVIPANLTVGDSITMGGVGFTFNVTIDGETTRDYAGASRTIVYASFSQLGSQLTYYWDKQTGIMVEASTTSGSITGTGKATETNMWQADPSPFWMQWWFYAIIAAIIAALATAVYFIKKRKPATPTAPSLPTEGT